MNDDILDPNDAELVITMPQLLAADNTKKPKRKLNLSDDQREIRRQRMIAIRENYKGKGKGKGKKKPAKEIPIAKEVEITANRDEFDDVSDEADEGVSQSDEEPEVVPKPVKRSKSEKVPKKDKGVKNSIYEMLKEQREELARMNTKLNERQSVNVYAGGGTPYVSEQPAESLEASAIRQRAVFKWPT